MGLLRRMRNWLQGREELTCPHGAQHHPFTAVIHGEERIIYDPSMCEPCTVAYLEKNATVCGACGTLIVPGTPIAAAQSGSPHPYVHAWCGDAVAYCGRWGEGRLVTLLEMFDADKRPKFRYVMRQFPRRLYL